MKCIILYHDQQKVIIIDLLNIYKAEHSSTLNTLPSWCYAEHFITKPHYKIPPAVPPLFSINKLLRTSYINFESLYYSHQYLTLFYTITPVQGKVGECINTLKTSKTLLYSLTIQVQKYKTEAPGASFDEQTIDSNKFPFKLAGTQDC